MKLRSILIPAALCAALAGTAWATLARPSAPGPVAIGEPHAILKRWEGTWDGQVSMAMAPGQTSPGTEVNRLIGGLWLVSEFKGDFMGMPFEGLGITGWDAENEVYTQTWVDSMSPALSTSEGSWNAEAGVLSFTGQGVDMLGQPAEQRGVTTWKGDDAMTVEMSMGGEPFMTIEYTRRVPQDE